MLFVNPIFTLFVQHTKMVGLSEIHKAKYNAACAAVKTVLSCAHTALAQNKIMRLGLGTGSTVDYFITELGRALLSAEHASLSFLCVASSERTQKNASESQLPLVEINTIGTLDMSVDGADEVDSQLNLIKGGGGALLYEKILAYASKYFMVIVDHSKIVKLLGTFPLPIEVVPFGYHVTERLIQTIGEAHDTGISIQLRKTQSGAIFITESGHYILDCRFDTIADPYSLSAALNQVPGIVEHGLFLDRTQGLYIGHPEGTVFRGSLPSLDR